MVGLLVFGGCIFDLDPNLDEDLWTCVNAIGQAGTKERILGAFKKDGLCPFTRACLQDKNVLHEIILCVDGAGDDEADPEACFYLDVEKIKHATCDAWKELRYNAAQTLRKDLRDAIGQSNGQVTEPCSE
jgi:hypothetical protein